MRSAGLAILAASVHMSPSEAREPPAGAVAADCSRVDRRFKRPPVPRIVSRSHLQGDGSPDPRRGSRVR